MKPTRTKYLRSVVIYDSTPAFSTYTSMSNGPLPNNLTAVATTHPTVGSTGPLRWDLHRHARAGRRRHRDIPGEPDAVASAEAEGAHDFNGRARLVERVKVQPRRAATKQFLALAGAVFDAELRHGFVIIADLVEAGEKRAGQFRAAHGHEFLRLAARENRQQAGDEWHVHAKLAGEIIAELEVVGVVEKSCVITKLAPARIFSAR